MLVGCIMQTEELPVVCSFSGWGGGGIFVACCKDSCYNFHEFLTSTQPLYGGGSGDWKTECTFWGQFMERWARDSALICWFSLEFPSSGDLPLPKFQNDFQNFKRIGK